MNKKLANLLYGDAMPIEFWQKQKRNLKKGAEVTRIAPSPTGFMHIGGIYQALIGSYVAKSTDGVFYMRLEDTDQKREIENAGQIAYDMLCAFGIKIDEGYMGEKQEEVGDFGPYKQSDRLEIYKSFAKYLVERGRAYPCFCTKTESIEEIEEKREQALLEGNKIEDKDVCRNLTFEEVEANIKAGKTFALRLKSQGEEGKSFEFYDQIKGVREVYENTKDIVLIKSNGVPVYAFAHVVDDTLMGTTLVSRGEEWYASVAAHLELFDAFGFERIKYAHTPVVCKLDEETKTKRKLSKRKDFESNSAYFVEQGIPIYATVEYLTNLINSNYETQKLQENINLENFKFSVSKIGTSSPMFDLVKLYDYAKTYIASLSANEVYKQTLAYAEKYDLSFAEFLKRNKHYCTKVFNIDREVAKPRKDLFKWSMVKDYYEYMWNRPQKFEVDADDKDKFLLVAKTYLENLQIFEDKQLWFENIKELCNQNNFATDNKAFKANPENFLGNTAKFCEFVRVAILGKKNTIDLYDCICALGKEEVAARLQGAIDANN